MKHIIFLIIFLILTVYFSKEKFKASNSLMIDPTGIIPINSPETKPIIENIKSKPVKEYKFQTESIIPTLKEEEIRIIREYLKKHFSTFIEIVRLKKEQQKNVKRYDIVFMIKDEKPYNHVILTKVIIENGKIFFNTLEYGGMVLPNELPSKQKEEDLFFINKSNNKIVFMDKKIEKELDKFEKRKLEILLRRGRKSA